MNLARPETDVRPWERITDPSVAFNELSREYYFKNLAGPGTTTFVDLRCRLTVKEGPTERYVAPFIFLVIKPYLLEQTEIGAAIFGPDEDLLKYKVLPVKIEAAATGISFIVFDESDGKHLLNILMLGRRLTLQLIRQSGESLGRIPLENDYTFRTKYESFESELLAGDLGHTSYKVLVETAQNNFPPHVGTVWLRGDEIWLSWPTVDVVIEGRSYRIGGGTITFPRTDNGRDALLNVLRAHRDQWAPGNEANLIKLAKNSAV